MNWLICGDRVVYRGERSPDYPDAAYRGTVVAVDGEPPADGDTTKGER
jgi:hypothetical protein